MTSTEQGEKRNQARIHFETFLHLSGKCCDHQLTSPDDQIKARWELMNLVVGEEDEGPQFNALDLRQNAELTIQQHGAYLFAELLLVDLKSNFFDLLRDGQVDPGSLSMGKFFESLGETIKQLSTPGYNATDRIHVTLSYYNDLYNVYANRR